LPILQNDLIPVDPDILTSNIASFTTWLSPNEILFTKDGGQGLTAEKMKECRWLKPVLVGEVEFL